MKSLLIGLFTIGILCTSSCVQDQEAAVAEVQPEVAKGPKMPKNIIFLIGDGMGLTQITAGLISLRDGMNLERCPVIGLMKTNSGDNLITDSAAGATAFSTGQKTYNGAIGVGMDTIRLTTILEYAEQNGLATGLVATASITHATPASYIAHQKNRYMEEEIAADFLKVNIDVFIGGGMKFFARRSDNQDLIASLKSKGYAVEVGWEAIDNIKSGKLAGFIADEHPDRVLDGRDMIHAQTTMKTIELLSANEKGFFMMSEGSQIDWGGHANDSEYIISEMQDFDYTIGKVLDWAEQNGETLVVITADHETGGYGIIGGDLEAGTVEGIFLTDYHTATMVPVFAFGPGAEAYAGMYHNTAIFNKMMASLQLNAN